MLVSVSEFKGVLVSVSECKGSLVKIKIEYSKLLNIILDKDKHINLQEQQIKELERLTLFQNVTYYLLMFTNHDLYDFIVHG